MRLLSIITTLSLVYITAFSQSPIGLFNSLPATSEVRAPEFNIEKKYFFCIDSINHQLIIISQQRHPETKQLHFDQQFFEIPLSQLRAQSFSIENDDYHDGAIFLIITLAEGQNNIISYWDSGNSIISIQSQNKLGLGPWPNDSITTNKLLEATNSISSQLISDNKSIEISRIAPPTFKYGTNRVTMIGMKDLDGKLNDDYYFADALEQPPIYHNSKNFLSSIKNLKKTIINQIRKSDNNITPQTPIFIHVDESGKVISINVAFKNPEEIFDTSNLIIDSFQPGLLNGTPVKCKIVIII